MSTSFLNIYNLNEVIKNDNRLQKKTANQLYSLYYLYLTYAISYFTLDCYQNLEDNIPFSQQEYLFTSDGIDNQYLLSSTPIFGCKFYVGFRESSDLIYTQIFNYTFDSNTNIITINNNPPLNYEVYISAYIIGQFNADLTTLEKSILSNGMLVPYSQEQEFKNSLLSQMVYGGTSKLYSQANHIREVKDVTNNQYFNVVKGMINEYSFKANPNGVKGLGGGNV